MGLQTTEIKLPEGTWQVLMRGDDVMIVDQHGRERHWSKGHVNTALHLAMMIAEHTRLRFGQEPNLDKALQMITEKFREGDES